MFSNRYIFIYSSSMVILVAIALTIVAVMLKPKQQYNQRVEKMQNTKKVGRIDAQNDFNVSVDMPGRRDHPAENHCDTCVPRKVLACHESTLLISVS